eukprot:8518465-Pyramimonas_sp.AAC.1
MRAAPPVAAEADHHAAGSPLAASWQDANQSEAFWGTGAGRSSSDCAFSLNMEAEIGHELNEDALSAFLDMMKCCETVKLSMLLEEARAVRFPMRLCWMAMQTHVQPRAIKAYGGFSYA